MEEEMITISVPKINNGSCAHPGNQFAKKLTTPELRQKAFDAYLNWLSRGKTKRSFSFVEEGLLCTYQTIEKYMKDNPTEFDPIRKDIAYAQGYSYWESVVDGTADGQNKQACVPALNMLMRNKFKWDQEKERTNFDEGTRSDLQRYSEDRKAERSSPPPEQSEDRND